MKTKTVTGNRRACIVALEEFVQLEVTKEKPALPNLTMIIEHSCKLNIPNRDDIYTVTFSVDLESGQTQFSATKAT